MPLIPEERLITKSGQRRSRALFKETCLPKDEPVASLGRTTGGLLPIRDLFVSYVAGDPTEYDFAMEVFGDFAHWKMIANTPWMEPYLEEWRETADVKRKRDAFKAVLEEAETGRSKFSAAKYLIEEPWKDKRNKEVKERSKRTSDRANSEFKDDIERLKDYM